MTKLALSNFIPSPSHTFHPTRVFYIHTHPNNSSRHFFALPFLSSSSSSSPDKDKNQKPTIDVFEITSSTLTNETFRAQLLDDPPKPDLVPQLEHVAREAEAPFLTITRKSWYTRSFEATKTLPDADGEDGEGKKEVVAKIEGPLLDLGHWKLSSPSPSAEGEATQHDIELRPTGPGSTTDAFVKDSVPYFWEMVKGRQSFRLWKAGPAEQTEEEEGGGGGGGEAKKGARKEIGCYVARNSRSASKEGVLVVDDRAGEGLEDVIVGIMTCIATVNRSDSFRK